MTTYQGERYVAEQLASILSQRALPEEVVIGDDASSDRTPDVLHDVARRSPVPIRVIRRDVNLGLARNVEEVLAACGGRVIVLSDQDDVWATGKVEAAAAAFDDPAVMLWFSDAELIGADGEQLGRTAWEAVHFGPAQQRLVGGGSGLRRLLHGQTVTGATMAIRREVLDVALPLPDEAGGSAGLYLHDGWLSVIAYLLGGAAVDPRRLTQYRQHAGQVTGMSMTGTPDVAGDGALGSRAAALIRDHARVKLVAGRIRHRDAAGRCRPEALAELLALEEFLERRILPRGTAGRRSGVIRSLLAGHYSRFARGWRTAAKDLL